MTTNWNCHSINDLQGITKLVLECCVGIRIFLFIGEMGAGKTTLIKTICNTLGTADYGSSPSFSLINEYSTAEGDNLYHMDLYRLNEIKEAYEIGIEDYLFSGHYCFIEWPEIIEPLLEGLEYGVIRIDQLENGMRNISLTKYQK
jgi:tRNA threonylcarbamoyladenosine biosynthesis protein TsaE